jgi:hypothetical protein
MSAQVSASGRSAAGGKGGVRFDRQLIAGEVRRREGERRVEVGERLGERLPGRPYIRSRLKLSKWRAAIVDRLPGLAIVVNAAERPEVRGLKLWMPSDRRLTPAARKAANFAGFDVPGLASRVISAPGSSGRRLRRAASS